MDKLFNVVNPIMQFLERVADLMIVNLLFLLCSIPLITVGASLAALSRVTQDIVGGLEPPVLRLFFKTFGNSIKKATVLWLFVLCVGGALCFCYLYLLPLLGKGGQLCRYLLLLVGVLILSVASYLFPLIGRYENSLRGYLSNALILSLGKLPTTLLLLALNILPAAMALLPMKAVVSLSFVWALIGFALFSLGSSLLLKPVFSQLESRHNK